MKCKNKCGRNVKTAKKGWYRAAQLRGLCPECYRKERREAQDAQDPKAELPKKLAVKGTSPLGRAFKELEKTMLDVEKLMGGLVGDSEELLVRARRLANEINRRIAGGRHMIERIEKSVREANAELRRQATQGFSLHADVKKAKSALPAVPHGHRFDKE